MLPRFRIMAVSMQRLQIGKARIVVITNELPRSKLRGIKPPLAYSYGPPVWRGRAGVSCVCSACEP